MCIQITRRRVLAGTEFRTCDLPTQILTFGDAYTNLYFFLSAKLVPVGYGINKLQVMCVVEDEKVSIDELCEQIQEFEDFVQSVDIAAMSKI